MNTMPFRPMEVGDSWKTDSGIVIKVVRFEDAECRICRSPIRRMWMRRYTEDGTPVGDEYSPSRTVCFSCFEAMSPREQAYEIDPEKAERMDKDGSFDITSHRATTKA